MTKGKTRQKIEKVEKVEKDIKYEEGKARTVLYVCLHQETLINFTNLARSKNKNLDRYIDEALAEKIEREKE